MLINIIANNPMHFTLKVFASALVLV